MTEETKFTMNPPEIPPVEPTNGITQPPAPPPQAVQSGPRNPASRVPAFWDLTEVEGDPEQIVGSNSATRETFSGTRADFKAFLRS